MYTTTHEQAYKIIDNAAQQNTLYHYNGGQAYIRYSMDSDMLVIIDHTSLNPKIEISDGANYFKAYANTNFEHSRALREHGSLLEWYTKTYKVGK
jgi:hypothetical protein